MKSLKLSTAMVAIIAIAISAPAEVSALTKFVDTDINTTNYISSGHVYQIGSESSLAFASRTVFKSAYTSGLELGNFSNARSVESVGGHTLVLEGTDLWIVGYGYPTFTLIASNVNDFGGSFSAVTVLKTDGTTAMIKLNTPNIKQAQSTSGTTLPEDVVSLCGGKSNQAALTSTGDVYVMGTDSTWSNYYGQMGVGNTTPVTPFIWTKAAVSNIASVDCSDSSMVLLTKTGNVLVAGQGGVNSSVFKSLGLSDATFISAGSNVTAITRKDGELYAIGWHNLIRYGLYNNSKTVTKLQGFANLKTFQSCGSHYVTVGEDGYLQTWGQNNAGQLGYFTWGTRVYAKMFNMETHAPQGAGMISLASVADTIVTDTPVLAPVVVVTTETVAEVVAVSTVWTSPETGITTTIDPVALTTTTVDDIEGIQTVAPIVAANETKIVVTITTTKTSECIAHNNGQNTKGNQIDYCKRTLVTAIN